MCIIIRPTLLCRAPRSRSGLPRRLPELRHDREHVVQRARQPIKLPDHDDITGAQVSGEPEELGPIPFAVHNPTTISKRV